MIGTTLGVLALPRGIGRLRKPLFHAFMEGAGFPLEPVWRPTRRNALHRFLQRELKQQRAVWHDAVGGKTVHSAQRRVDLQPTPRSLIHVSGEQVPIEQHDPTSGQRGRNGTV
jgi:hypothetical protein